MKGAFRDAVIKDLFTVRKVDTRQECKSALKNIPVYAVPARKMCQNGSIFIPTYIEVRKCCSSQYIIIIRRGSDFYKAIKAKIEVKTWTITRN